MANVRASPQQMVMVIAGAAGGEVYSINFPAHLWQQTTPYRTFKPSLPVPNSGHLPGQTNFAYARTAVHAPRS